MTTSQRDQELRALIGGADAAGEPPAEADLFGDELSSPIQRQAVRLGVTRRGPGRPEGAQGRASLDVAKFLKATRRPALLALQDVADMTWSDLAKALGGVEVADAAEFWRKCVAELLPYVERRQPLAVELPAGALAIPVVIFGNEGVRPDLVDGNPPLDGAFTVAEGGEGADCSRPIAHDEDETLTPQGFEPDG